MVGIIENSYLVDVRPEAAVEHHGGSVGEKHDEWGMGKKHAIEHGDGGRGGTTMALCWELTKKRGEEGSYTSLSTLIKNVGSPS
jgi:hypothetical protein